MRKLFTISALFIAFSLLAQEKEAPLTEVLRDIEDRFQVRFAYDYHLVTNATAILPDYTLPLNEVLKSTFSESNLTYQSGNRVIIIKPRSAVFSSTRIEPKDRIQLSGFIKDETTGEPLQHATLHIIATRLYGTTNAQGYFLLKNVPYDTSSIEIKHLGYQSAVIKPNQFRKGLAQIRMMSKPEVLDPIVVKDQSRTFSIHSDAGAISMNPGNVQLLSSFGQPDIIRSIQLLPGVDGSSESSSGLSIRGGSTDQNLVLFDGFSVFNLGHFFGTLSAFNANVINNVDVFKGGFGVEYGTRVSGVLDIQSKESEFKGRTRGNFSLDLMSVNMMVESAVSDKVSFLIAGRRSYTDLIKTNVFSSITNNVIKGRPSEVSSFGQESFIENVNPEFGYYDVNAKVNVSLGEGQKLGISFYNSGDELQVIDHDFLDNASTDVFYEQRYKEVTAWGNTGASLNYEREWSPLLSSKMTLAQSSSFRFHELDYFLDFYGEGFSYYEDINVKDKNFIGETSFRLDNKYQIDRNSALNFGLFSIRNNIEYHNSFNLNSNGQSLRENAHQIGVYVQQTYSPIPKLTVTGGLRGTYHSGNDNTYLEPRASLNYKLTPSLNFKGAVGRYYQFVSQVTSNNPFATQQSFWLVSDGVNVATVGSNHFMGGVTFENNIITLDIEGYYKTLDGLTTYALDSGFQDLMNDQQKSALYRGSGSIKGMDVMISKDLGKLSSWVSYSLSYATNKFQNVNNGFQYHANQDQRHEAKWVNTIEVGKWEFSSTFVYGSGRPYTGFPFEIGETVVGEDIVDQLILGGVNTNNKRIPAYHRLDLGMAYSTEFGKQHTADGKIGINFFNLYNRTNIRDIRYDFDVNLETRELVRNERRLKLLAFTPSLYLNFNF